MTALRHGGRVVVETLEKLGVSTVFGIPGQHALALFDALHDSTIEFISSRVENNAAFMADGYARATGRVGVLFVSTGPGALTSLAALQEARATAVPLVVISSQVPRSGLHAARKGMLHQLDDQQSAAAQVAKQTQLVTDVADIPGAVQRAWNLAQSPPNGPVWIEIPQDVLMEPVENVVESPEPPLPPLAAQELELSSAATLLASARRPAIVAGGGVRRAGAQPELLALAERLQAPVVTAPGGHGAFPWEHPLSLQAWVEDRAVTDLLADADVLLVTGSSLGEVTSNYFSLQPRGAIVQIDAEPLVIGSNHAVTGICADARLALEGLLERLPQRINIDSETATDTEVAARVRAVLARVARRLDAQNLSHERSLLQAIRDAVPDDTQTFWDMTMLSYWAWSAWDSRGDTFHSAQGAGGLGFAFPAALGAAAGTGQRTLAIAGDGSAMYGIAELATAVQHQLPVTWLIVDDGGYGILREYMNDAFGRPTATELARPEFAALATSFGVSSERVGVSEVGDALIRAAAATGPRVVVLETQLRMFAPS